MTVSGGVTAEGGTFTNDVTFDGATAGTDIVFDRSDNALEFADNAKATFGNGDRLVVRHSSSDCHSYIEESGSGNLVIRADALYIENAGANHSQMIVDSDADVKLSFAGTHKFQTTTDGAKIMGTGNFVLPSGTTAQRGSASTGAIRYNTTTSQL